MINDTAILFEGSIAPVQVDKFKQKFCDKYTKWGNSSSTELEKTWSMNCCTLNYAIKYKNKIIKYVISASTGTAKTQNLITYCSMLPSDITVLISTNLIDEADKIANEINEEARNIIAYSYNSNHSKSIDQAAKHQIVITTHAFYKLNYAGGTKWNKIGANRDLIVIDEALDTSRELSVNVEDIEQAIAFFSSSKIESRFSNNPRYKMEMKALKKDLNILKSSKNGTHLIHSDKTFSLDMKHTNLSLKLSKYKLFSIILGINIFNEKPTGSLIRFINSIKYHKTLTPIDDDEYDITIKERLINTIDGLNKMLKDRQTYITANKYNKSYNRVEDIIFDKPVVCFDATAGVNEVYKLREKHYKDIHMLPRYNARDYSNVIMHTVKTKTSKDSININTAKDIIKSVTLGKKTLIVTNKKNETLFEQAVNDIYPDKIVEMAHWNAITGLNEWQNFDTCIIVGLNHKPRFFAQNKFIVNTDTEERAFGQEQNHMNSLIEDSEILAEIIQAINRIRVRKVIDSSGGCKSANIYIALPHRRHLWYKTLIKEQMPNIQIVNWTLSSGFVHKRGDAHIDSIISYLQGNLKSGKIEIFKVRDALNIKPDSFRDIIGKNENARDLFKYELAMFRFGIKSISTVGSRNRHRKTDPQYFYKL